MRKELLVLGMVLMTGCATLAEWDEKIDSAFGIPTKAEQEAQQKAFMNMTPDQQRAMLTMMQIQREQAAADAIKSRALSDAMMQGSRMFQQPEPPRPIIIMPQQQIQRPYNCTTMKMGSGNYATNCY